MVLQELVREKRSVVADLVFLLRRREIAGTGNGALEHEMEHRGAAAINPTKGTFRIRTAPPLKPPLLLLSNAPPERHSARTNGRDICSATAGAMCCSSMAMVCIDGKENNRQQFDDPRFQPRASSGAEAERARDRSDVSIVEDV